VLELSKQDPAEQKDLPPTGSSVQGFTQTFSIFSFLLTSFNQLPFSWLNTSFEVCAFPEALCPSQVLFATLGSCHPEAAASVADYI